MILALSLTFALNISISIDNSEAINKVLISADKLILSLSLGLEFALLFAKAFKHLKLVLSLSLALAFALLLATAFTRALLLALALAFTLE